MAEYDITAQITAALQEYSYDVADRVDAAAEACSKGLRKDLKSSSPSRTGAYAKSWATKADREYTEGSKVYTTYNRKHFQLTHLLENGHGGPAPAPAHVHIHPSEKKWTDEFVQLCEEACAE